MKEGCVDGGVLCVQQGARQRGGQSKLKRKEERKEKGTNEERERERDGDDHSKPLSRTSKQHTHVQRHFLLFGFPALSVGLLGVSFSFLHPNLEHSKKDVPRRDTLAC